MVGLSLIDKSNLVDNVEADEITKKKTLKTGWTIMTIAAIVGIIAAFFVIPYHTFAPEAVYVLVAGFLLVGMIMVFNVSSKTMNAKGIITNSNLYKTSMPFNIAAVGICGILATLYYLFW